MDFAVNGLLVLEPVGWQNGYVFSGICATKYSLTEFLSRSRLEVYFW